MKTSPARMILALALAAGVGVGGAAAAQATTAPQAPAVSQQVEPIFTATDANWQTAVLDKSKERLVIVDFWAPWCGPCKTLKPIIEQEAKDGKGAWLLGELDSDQNKSTANAAKIKYLPTLIAYADGVVLERKDGFTGGKSELQAWIKAMLAKKPAPAPGAPAPGAPAPAPKPPVR